MLVLNKKKIEAEMEKQRYRVRDIAKATGRSDALISYAIHHGSVKYAGLFAGVLGCQTMDLVYDDADPFM